MKKNLKAFPANRRPPPLLVMYVCLNAVVKTLRAIMFEASLVVLPELLYHCSRRGAAQCASASSDDLFMVFFVVGSCRVCALFAGLFSRHRFKRGFVCVLLKLIAQFAQISQLFHCLFSTKIKFHLIHFNLTLHDFQDFQKFTPF